MKLQTLIVNSKGERYEAIATEEKNVAAIGCNVVAIHAETSAVGRMTYTIEDNRFTITSMVNFNAPSKSDSPPPVYKFVYSAMVEYAWQIKSTLGEKATITYKAPWHQVQLCYNIGFRAIENDDQALRGSMECVDLFEKYKTYMAWPEDRSVFTRDSFFIEVVLKAAKAALPTIDEKTSPIATIFQKAGFFCSLNKQLAENKLPWKSRDFVTMVLSDDYKPLKQQPKKTATTPSKGFQLKLSSAFNKMLDGIVASPQHKTPSTLTVTMQNLGKQLKEAASRTEAKVELKNIVLKIEKCTSRNDVSSVLFELKALADEKVMPDILSKLINSYHQTKLDELRKEYPTPYSDRLTTFRKDLANKTDSAFIDNMILENIGEAEFKTLSAELKTHQTRMRLFSQLPPKKLPIVSLNDIEALPIDYKALESNADKFYLTLYVGLRSLLMTPAIAPLTTANILKEALDQFDAAVPKLSLIDQIKANK